METQILKVHCNERRKKTDQSNNARCLILDRTGNIEKIIGNDLYYVLGYVLK